MNELERTAGLAATPGYEYARRTDSQLHVAGQVPHNSSGQLVGVMDPLAQAAQCLTNLNTLLSVHGFSTHDIQRLVVYVVGEQENLTRAWAGVQQWFSGTVPPATLLGVACLGHPGQLVEVDATVIKSSAQAQ
ncbi:MAG: RidA family protein [Polaromonas sp.]|uniref:RidA family protein n=1 Tax=Polaromonas sp. TaxID=1869339 RepID=UPI002733907B|nr:RidA family protein [Polaromonas sp.]MDP3246560.1 RidA family protein [Polaromonas sp.]